MFDFEDNNTVDIDFSSFNDTWRSSGSVVDEVYEKSEFVPLDEYLKGRQYDDSVLVECYDDSLDDLDNFY